MHDVALADHVFLAGFEARHLEIIDTCLIGVSSWTAGEVILMRGYPTDRLHLIVEGTVAIEIRSPGAAPTVIQTLSGGDVLGWSWLFEPYLWTFDARAVTDASAFSLDANLLRSAVSDDPEFGVRFVTRMTKAIVNRLKATRLQVLDVYHH